jgi:hypothetical protein
MLFVTDRETAAEASLRVLGDWDSLSKAARETAVECFDSVKNLTLLLG